MIPLGGFILYDGMGFIRYEMPRVKARGKRLIRKRDM